MGRRLHQRFKKELTVTIFGSDRAGQPFSQTATVVDVSEQGVRLEGVAVLDHPGGTVVLDHDGNRAKYRVVWVGADAVAGQAGLVNLEPNKSIFKLAFPVSARDDYIVPSEPTSVDDGFRKLVEARRAAEQRKEERRQYPRYACRGDAEIYTPRTERPERGQLCDISRGGCFIELLQPFALNTEVTLTLQIAERRVRVQGMVRSALPNFGVGIQFLRFEPEDLRRLEEVLAALEHDALPSGLSTPEPGAGAQPVVTPTPDTQRSLEVVLSWFQTNEVLTRQEFYRLLANLGPTSSSNT